MAKKQNQPNTPPPAMQAQPRPAVKTTQEPGKGMSTVMKLAILLGIIAFVVYFNTLGHGFVLDDFTVIKNNKIVRKGISAIPEILGTPYRRGWFITQNDLYRPLSLVMFAIEYQLGNGSAWAGHFMNVLVYAGGVVALFLFLHKLLGEKRMVVAFIAAVLFALHPIHTEVVANIKSRDELLCFFLAFVSLNYFMDYAKGDKIKHLLLGGIMLFLSFLSKETVISFLGVIPFIFFFYRNEYKDRSIKITAVAVGVTGIFLAIRYAVLAYYDANLNSDVVFMDNILAKPPSAMAALATEILILGKYIKLLVVPYPLISDYSYNSIPFATFADIWVILSLIFHLGIGVYGLMRLMKNKRDPYAFAILFYLATIALFSNIPFVIGAAMAERFVFFASVGFCLAVALLADQFVIKSNEREVSLTSGKVLGILLPLGLLYAGITNARNKDWADNPTLFKADVVNAPQDSRMNYYLGTELVTESAPREGNPVVRKQILFEGIGYLRKALEINEKYDDAHAAVGDAYFKIGLIDPGNGMFDSALLHGKRALELNPKFVVAMNNLAGAYYMTNKVDTAIMYCHRSLATAPTFVNAYANLGLCFSKIGRFDSSLYYLYKAIATEPTFASSYENISFTYQGMGKSDSAAKYKRLFEEVKAGGVVAE